MTLALVNNLFIIVDHENMVNRDATNAMRIIGLTKQCMLWQQWVEMQKNRTTIMWCSTDAKKYKCKRK